MESGTSVRDVPSKGPDYSIRDVHDHLHDGADVMTRDLAWGRQLLHDEISIIESST